MKFECAFIYVAPGCDPAKERTVIEGDSINMNVTGCATYAQAEEIAKEMVAKGCSAIELCAGFGNEGIARIKRAVGPGIAVGAVKFDFHPAFEFKSGDDMFGWAGPRPIRPQCAGKVHCGPFSPAAPFTDGLQRVSSLFKISHPRPGILSLSG